MSEAVRHPGHYLKFGVEVSEIIRMILNSPENRNQTMYEAYCMGNEIKYRLRAGFKGDPGQDVEKAMQYYQMRSPLYADKAEEADALTQACEKANKVLTDVNPGSGWESI